jgi:hypothetical protein
MSSQKLKTPDGRTMVAYGGKALLSVTGQPATVKPSSTTEKLDYEGTVGKYKIAFWGSSNNFPQTAYTYINKSTVLKPGLRYKHDTIMGQGVFPVYVEGFNDDGSEILKMVKDANVTNLLQSRMIRRYLSTATRDVLKYGLCFPELLPTMDGKNISGIQCINAMHGRWELAGEKSGMIENLIISGLWPDAKEESISVVPVLDNFDPLFHLNVLKTAGKFGKSVIYPLKDEFDGATYYPFADWFTAEQSGWLEISRQIPDYIRNMYKNQASFKYHIKVPHRYWDKRFPRHKYAQLSNPQYSDMIDAEIDTLIDNVTDTKNANKAVLTHFDFSVDGKYDGIEIAEFSQKWSNEQLMTSAIANSEILASLGINPAVRGLMPGSSIYAGNQGGSNIREAFLIDNALSWVFRAMILDPLDDMMRFNGFDPAIQLRFRSTFLTTLDTGGGTGKNLS